MNLKKIGLASLVILALGVMGFLYTLFSQVPGRYEWEGRGAPAIMPAPMPVLPRIGVSPPKAAEYHICLLYTSPSPRDRG